MTARKDLTHKLRANSKFLCNVVLIDDFSLNSKDSSSSSIRD